MIITAGMIRIAFLLLKGATAFKAGNTLEGASGLWEAILSICGKREEEFESIFRKSIKEALESYQHFLKQKAGPEGYVAISEDDFISALSAEGLSLTDSALLKMKEEEFVGSLVNHLKPNLLISGNKLTEYDVEQICRNLLRRMRVNINELVEKNHDIFERLISDLVKDNNFMIKEVAKMVKELATNGDNSERLVVIEQKLDHLLDAKKVTFEKFLSNIYSEFQNTDFYNDRFKRRFMMQIECILAELKDKGEEHFHRLINSIIVPFPKTFQEKVIDYEKDTDIVKNIVVQLLWLKVVFPHMCFEFEIGKPLVTSNQHKIAYLYSRKSRGIEYELIDFLDKFYYVNKVESIDAIERYIVNKSTINRQQSCTGNEGVVIDLPFIISKLTDVPYIDQTEISNIEGKKTFKCHCASCLAYDMVNDFSVYEERLKEKLEG